MKTFDKIYIAFSERLIAVLKENKRLFSALFVVNLTYLAQIFSMGSVLEGYHDGNSILLWITIFFLLQVFVTTAILSLLPKIFARIFIGLSAFFFPVDALVLALHRSLFDESIFQVLLDTNWQEAVEFLDNYSTLIFAKIFWTLPLAMGLVLCFKASVKFIDFVLSRRSRFVRNVMIFGLLFAATISWIIGSAYLFFPRIGISAVRMPLVVADAFREIREYQEVYKNIDATQFEITRNDSRLPWVIFILGESTGRAHMSLYGYDKPTNPKLQRRLEQNEFVLFSDCISGGYLTMLACERLFTFYDNRVEDNGKPWYLYPNLFDILKAAGYHTVWLSNQESSGIYGNVPRAYADRCDEKNFTVIRDTSTFVYEYDEKLLPLLEESLEKKFLPEKFLHLAPSGHAHRLSVALPCRV